MNANYVRSVIDEFGRSTMRDAMSRHLSGMAFRDIAAEIGLDEDRVGELIAVEKYLESMSSDSRYYVDAVIDRD